MEYEEILLKELRDSKLLKNRTPLSAGIELLSQCNFRCVHCYEAVEREDNSYLNTKRILSIIDECVELGVLSLYFTGGEAMLRKDFKEIYRYCRKKGILIGILSNGTSLTPDIIELFLEYAPMMIDISLYGASEDTYKKVTKTIGAFEIVQKNLKLLSKNAIPFNLKTVLLKDNYFELEQMKEIAKKYNVPFRFYTDIRPLNCGDKSPQDYMLPEECIIEIEKNDVALKEFYMSMNEEQIGMSCRKKENKKYLCKIAQNGFFITYDGILHGCVRERLHGYDLKEGSLKEGWNKFLPEHYIYPSEEYNYECAKCDIIKYCDYCPAQFELETGSPTKPPQRTCRIAHLRYETFH